MTPFQALYGRPLPHLVCFVSPTSIDSLDNMMLERNAILDELQLKMARFQQIMCHYANKHRQYVSYQIGDSIYLKLQPYRQKSLASRPNRKPPFFGPYTISQKIGPVAYKLKLPPTCLIHRVFHASQLKAAIRVAPVSSSLPTFQLSLNFVQNQLTY